MLSHLYSRIWPLQSASSWCRPYLVVDILTLYFVAGHEGLKVGKSMYVVRGGVSRGWLGLWGWIRLRMGGDVGGWTEEKRRPEEEEARIKHAVHVSYGYSTLVR